MNLEQAQDYIAFENMFGRPLPDFQGLSEDQKRQIWRERGGLNFPGEVGDIYRYVVGVSRVGQDILLNGFSVGKHSGNSWRMPGFKWLGLNGETEGTGIYMTTNPTLALREYGPQAVIADVATGRCLDYQADRRKYPFLGFIRTLGRSILPTQLAACFYVYILQKHLNDSERTAIILAGLMSLLYLNRATSVCNSYYQHHQADTVRLPSNQLGTMLSSARHFPTDRDLGLLVLAAKRHQHWLLVRDPRRINPVAVIDHPVQALSYTS